MTDPTNKVVFPRTAHQKPKQALKPQIINYKIIIQLVGRGLGWRRFHRNRLKKYKILLKAVKEDQKKFTENISSPCLSDISDPS